MRPRAFCVSHDDAVCASVDRALAAAGLVVEHVRDVPADTSGAALLIVDRGARQAGAEALRAQPLPVIVVGDDLDDDALIALMLEAPVSHLVEDPRDRTLEVTSAKLASGDVWGLEKYLAGDVAVHERVVRSDRDKRRAMDEVCSWAESVGARRTTLHRIASVVDELLMNALLAMPAVGSTPPIAPRAVLRWASDDRTLAVSVLDDFGSLCQRELIDHVRRARRERGRPQPAHEGGAGLGLYFVLANVAGLVVNIAPGRQTISRPRSLHVFADA